MPRIPIICLVLGLALGPAAAGGFAAATGPDAGAARYKYTAVGKDGHHLEKEFDPANEDHRRELLQHLSAAEVQALEKQTKTNLLDIKWDLGLWTLVVFILLYLILRKAAWGPMLEGLQRREDNIKAALEESRQAREEAASLRQHLASERAKIAEEVRKALDEAREDGRRLVEEMQARAKGDIAADRDRLRREIETARDQALQDLWNRSVELATLISAKTIRRNLSTDDHRRLVDEAMTDLAKANVGWKERTLY